MASLSALDAGRTTPVWQDPQCFGVGKEPAHCAMFAHETRTAALSGQRTGSERFVDLNGEWDFKW